MNLTFYHWSIYLSLYQCIYIYQKKSRRKAKITFWVSYYRESFVLKPVSLWYLTRTLYYRNCIIANKESSKWWIHLTTWDTFITFASVNVYFNQIKSVQKAQMFVWFVTSYYKGHKPILLSFELFWPYQKWMRHQTWINQIKVQF